MKISSRSAAMVDDATADSGSDTRDDGEVHGRRVTAQLRRTIADAVTADTGRQDLLVAYAHELGPDPSLAHLDDEEVAHAVRVGAAEIAAATARWLTHLAELVVRGVWADDGATTPAAWLSWALGMAPSTAREHVRVALRLRECPEARARMAAGRLSYSKARAITRVATHETEQLLLEWADAAPAHVLERIISDARRVQRIAAEPEQRDDLGVTRRWREDGTYELVLRVDGGTGLALEQHLDRLVELDDPEAVRTAPGDAPTADGETADGAADDGRPAADASQTSGRPRAVREADLLVGAVASAVEADPDDTSGGDRHLVVVHTTPAELLAASAASADATPTEGTPAGDQTVGASSTALPTTVPDRGVTASAEADDTTGRRAVLPHDGRGRVRAMSARTLWRLACAARLRVAVSDDGHPADNGRARRTPDTRLRRLLHARDRSCRFPGCGATRYLHAHHVVHWEDDGPTDLDNLVLLCGQHHRTVHTGWRLRSVGRGRWTFHAPGDRRQEARPWARPLPGASAEALTAVARAHAHDLAPAARARLLEPPYWDGGGYDHDLTVEILSRRLELAA